MRGRESFHSFSLCLTSLCTTNKNHLCYYSGLISFTGVSMFNKRKTMKDGRRHRNKLKWQIYEKISINIVSVKVSFMVFR